MARIDQSRTALELDDDELTAAGALLLDPDAEFMTNPEVVEVINRLEEAGVAVNGELQGYAARIVAVLAQPEFRVMVERFAGADVQRDFAAVSAGYGIWGEPSSAGNEFTPIEPSLIPWGVSRAVGLGPRVKPSFDQTIEVRGTAAQKAMDSLNKLDADGAEATLEEDGLDTESRKALINLLLDRRLTWRVVSGWKDASGENQGGAVAVVDGGESGLWLSEHLANAAGEPTVRLEPTASGTVWEQIVDVTHWPRGGESDTD